MANSFIQGGIQKPGSIWGPSQGNTALDSVRATVGVGCTVKRLGGGLTVNTPKYRSRPQTILDFPWQVTITVSGGSSFATVNKKSDLLLSLKPNDNITVTGLGSPFPFIPGNDLIWIYMVVASQTVTSATIQSYGQGNSGFNPTLNAWDNSGGYVQDDGGTPPDQIAANVMIFESYTDGLGNVVNKQQANTHFVIKNMCIDGQPAQFVQPSPYGRYQ